MTLPPLTNQDPGDEQPELFSADQYSRRTCPCGAKSKNLCVHSANLAHGIAVGKRPRNCLLSPDPLRDPFPPGY